MYVELPLISTSTPVERIAALQTAKDLLTATPGRTSPAIFGGGSTETVYAPETVEMIRLAEYITTGHDYKDTHPVGKRRPIIKQTTVNVHTVGGPEDGPTPEDIEHLLSHVADGSFAQFMEDALAEATKHAAEEGVKEDEAEHQPQAEGDRPRFAPKATDFDL